MLRTLSRVVGCHVINEKNGKITTTTTKNVKEKERILRGGVVGEVMLFPFMSIK